jgi:hypothetical protein
MVWHLWIKMKKLTRASFAKQNQVNNNSAKKGSIVGFIDTRDNERYTNQAICPWTDEIMVLGEHGGTFLFSKKFKDSTPFEMYQAGVIVPMIKGDVATNSRDVEDQCASELKRLSADVTKFM